MWFDVTLPESCQTDSPLGESAMNEPCRARCAPTWLTCLKSRIWSWL